MEVALFLLSIVSACFAPIMGQTVSIAPMDIDTSCRNSFRTRAPHDWIPYVNDTSDGVRGEVKWQVILDQYDYSTLIEQNPSLSSLWAVADFDGDGLTFTVSGGGNCANTLGLTGTSYENPNTNNWVFTQAVDYIDAIEIYVNATVGLRGCLQRASAVPPCRESFVTLYRYDSNSPATAAQRTNTANYQPYLGDSAMSRLEHNDAGLDSSTSVVTYLRPQNFDFTHFGIQDTGTFGTVTRLIVYYKVAQGYEDGLVVCPSVALPAMRSGGMNTKSCTCKANSSPTPAVSLVRTCDENGACRHVDGTACQCDPGYEYNATQRMCRGCPLGTYKGSMSSTARCIPCPGNSMTLNTSSTVCDCIRGTVRCPSRPDDACQSFEDFFAGEVDCDEASSQSGGVNRAGAIAITFFVTLIITVVVSVLVVLVILFLYKKFCK